MVTSFRGEDEGESLNMTAEAKRLFELAMALAPVDRLGLIDNLISSLDRADEKVDAVWREEIERRLAAYESGRAGTLSLDEVMSRLRQA